MTTTENEPTLREQVRADHHRRLVHSLALAERSAREMEGGERVAELARAARHEVVPPTTCMPWCLDQTGHAEAVATVDQWCISESVQTELSREPDCEFS